MKTEEEKEKICGKRKYFLRRRREIEIAKGENMWRRKIVFCGGEEKRRRVGRNIFGKGKYFFVEEKKKEILIDLVS